MAGWRLYREKKGARTDITETCRPETGSYIQSKFPEINTTQYTQYWVWIFPQYKRSYVQYNLIKNSTYEYNLIVE